MSVGKRGQPVSAAVKARREALLDYLSPLRALERVESRTQWVFTTVTAVGALATTASGALGGLEGRGRLVFGAAIAFTGLSMAAAATALNPTWTQFRPSRPHEVAAAVRESLRRRHRWQVSSVVLLAIALGLAAAAPLMSLLGRSAHPSPSLVFTQANGSVSGIAAVGADLPIGTVVEVILSGAGDSVLARARGVVEEGVPFRVVLPDMERNEGELTLVAWYASPAHGVDRIWLDTVRFTGSR